MRLLRRLAVLAVVLGGIVVAGRGIGEQVSEMYGSTVAGLGVGRGTGPAAPRASAGAREGSTSAREPTPPGPAGAPAQRATAVPTDRSSPSTVPYRKAGAATLTVEPSTVLVGDSFVIQLQGFRPGEEVIVEIYESRTGNLLFSTTVTVDASGDSWVSLRSEPSDPVGANSVVARGLSDGSLAEGSYYLTSSGEGTASRGSRAPPGSSPTPTRAGERESDVDQDGIPDGIEDRVAKTFMPYFVLDEEEHPQEIRWIYQVTPVRQGGEPRWVLFIVAALYQEDYAPIDLPSGEKDVFWHYGDTESIRIYLSWRPVLGGGPYDGEYRIEHVTIRRHYEAHEYEPSAFAYHGGSHPYVLIAEGKHAMYPSVVECEGSDMVDLVGFVDSDWLKEDCGGGLEVMPRTDGYNVGESNLVRGVAVERRPQRQLFSWGDEHPDLRVFPREAIWEQDYPFCGGSPVGDMRWAEKQIVLDLGILELDLGREWGYCGGGVEGKWYYEDATDERRWSGFWPNKMGERHR